MSPQPCHPATIPDISEMLPWGGFGGLTLGKERRSISLRVEFWDRNPQRRGKFQNFEVGYPADATLDAGNHPARNVPALKLADRGKLFLGPAARGAKKNYLTVDNISWGIHTPVHLSGLKSLVVWNSEQRILWRNRYDEFLRSLSTSNIQHEKHA